MPANDQQPYSLHFTLTGLPLTTNGARAKQGHWRARHKADKGWKSEVWLACYQGGRPKAPLKRARVTLVRHSSSEPDYEGLVSSFKSVLDGLTEAGIIVDDNTSVIGKPDYLWKKAKPKEGRIEVLVNELIVNELTED